MRDISQDKIKIINLDNMSKINIDKKDNLKLCNNKNHKQKITFWNFSQ